uniref:glutamate--cysteine ligase n=1 Tax=Thaumasiovibrio occultus TaxID=1891184 RepID=UPI000B351771|nr:glutamate--cysteine ligase [Thaumasiovibrio occultus]
MNSMFQKSLDNSLIAFLDSAEVQHALPQIRRGIEREMLRTTPHGALADSSHPHGLGSALTHPYITTDFAESQLELVTPATTDRDELYQTLATLHHAVARQLENAELVWSASMPPALPSEEAIRIGDYGSSNAGSLKRRYREGLANRYGKRMQMISGIHYNFSLPTAFWQALHAFEQRPLTLEEFTSERYFHLIRNVLRYGWIMPYLFGASPTADASYLANQHALPDGILPWDDSTIYGPWATSLRTSNLGYSSAEQSRYPLRFDSRQTYLADLCRVLKQPSERYTHLDTEQQLNGAVLQLENELYGSIRPKIVNAELRPIVAMQRHGVQYVELRSVDNNPYLAYGIDQHQGNFLDAFLTFCALMPSPEISDEERQIIATRQEIVSRQGRQPNLHLPTLEGDMALQTLGLALTTAMQPIAAALDSAYGTAGYQLSLQHQADKFADSELTPSAQLLTEMKAENVGHVAKLTALSRAHLAHYHQQGLTPESADYFEQLATESLANQTALENEPQPSFEQFFAQKYQLDCGCEPLQQAG